MRAAHVIVIVATLIALAFCGHDTGCNSHMPAMERVADIILSGTIGNALGAAGERAMSKKLKGPGAT